VQTIESLVRRIESLPASDPFGKPIQRLVRRVVARTDVHDALTGRWLGHALHPMLTDLPIGFWTSAFMLDFVGGKKSRAAAQRLIGLGVLSALPAIATGATDWADTTDEERRVGFVHAALNTAALACFTASWLARRRGRHGRGIVYGLAGSTAATGGGYLGGHLVQRMGLGIDNTTFDEAPSRWTATLPATEFADETPRRVLADRTPVMVVRERGVWHALDNRCSHRGGPLDEGTIVNGCSECPWHGSRFRLEDGTVARGPAAAPQPVIGVRVRDDVVEVGPPPS
jgi:nitrite reductase/ring-hydroxylating ferredoxin subunit/uncharacterized membrane protein